MELLFVYGTLLKENLNEMSRFLHSNAKFYCNAYFNGKLFDIENYPGAVLSSNNQLRVFGKLFALNNANDIFKMLDTYEEVGSDYDWPNEYIRKKIKVFTKDDKEFEAWIYLYNHSTQNLKQIANGNYLTYRKWE